MERSQVDLAFFRYTGLVLICFTLISGGFLISITIKENEDLKLAQDTKTQSQPHLIVSSAVLDSSNNERN